MLDRPAQLAHISRPVVAQDRFHRVRRQLLRRLAVLLGELLEKRIHQKRDVLLAVAQRRHHDRHHAEAEEKVVAKFSLAHHLLEVPVRGRDEPHVHLDRRIPAHALERPLLAQHAEQLHLRGRVDLADFIEENGAAIRLLEAPDAPLARAGERAFLVAEKLALEQLRRQRRAVDRDEFLLRPSAQRVDRLRHELLARAALALDQHGRARGRHLPDRVEDFRHHRGFADQFFEPIFPLDLLL